MDEHTRDNRKYWDELARLHVDAPFYKTNVFRSGDNIIDPLARKWLGDVVGKKLLHLQCHFGLEILSLARMGANVTGLDFSPNAVAIARALSSEANLTATFIEADVLAPPDDLRDFDIVFASWGVLCWISDLSAWMGVAARALKPGGRLVLLEGHPAAMMLDLNAPSGAPRVVHPYDSSKPIMDETQGSYADHAAVLESPRTVLWAHGIGPILTAMLEAGFKLRAFAELDCVPWPMPCLDKVDEHYWKLRQGMTYVPLSFALSAEL